MSNFRHARVQNRIAHVISELIVRNEIKDHRVNSMLSVSDVSVSKDGAYAKIKVSGFLGADELKNAVAGLNSAAGFIQKSLASRLRTRNTPRLTFMCDEGLAQGFEITQQLKALDNADSGSNSH